MMSEEEKETIKSQSIMGFIILKNIEENKE